MCGKEIAGDFHRALGCHPVTKEGWAGLALLSCSGAVFSPDSGGIHDLRQRWGPCCAKCSQKRCTPPNYNRLCLDLRLPVPRVFVHNVQEVGWEGKGISLSLAHAC